MYQQIVTGSVSRILEQAPSSGAAVARSGELDALVALEQIGRRHSFSRDAEIYADGDASDCWYIRPSIPLGIVGTMTLARDGRNSV